MQFLALADVEQMIRVIAEACDPGVQTAVSERKQLLLQGIADLIDANMWIWNVTVLNPARTADVMATKVIDGGWQNENERVNISRLLTDPQFNQEVIGPVQETVRQLRSTTFLRSELIDDYRWQKVGTDWRAAGYDQCLLSIYPLDARVFSAVGFHRRVGRAAFGEREKSIVHAVFQQVDWLHRDGADVPANEFATQLSARERHVLVFLLGGDSRKEIARRLQLSEHTVGDYLKEIYRKFCVSSRAELLSHFIAGCQAPIAD
jgi:DNA-binding CsgD family transcriptional regulator